MFYRSTNATTLPAVLFLWFLFLPSSATAQDAIVTVYNHGSNWTSGLPGTNHGLYWGCVYDSEHPLNCFREQKVFAQFKNNRFAVFHLSPGPHVFSASYDGEPSNRSQLNLVLEKGKHYYLRAQSESRGIGIVEVEFGRLDNMPCADALRDLAKAKPLPDKVISPQGRAALVAAQAIPSCP